MDSVPPNLKFIVDDVESPWGYEEKPFDFIHARFLVGGIKDMPKLVEQSFKSVQTRASVRVPPTHVWYADNETVALSPADGSSSRTGIPKCIPLMALSMEPT